MGSIALYCGDLERGRVFYVQEMYRFIVSREKKKKISQNTPGVSARYNYLSILVVDPVERKRDGASMSFYCL